MYIMNQVKHITLHYITAYTVHPGNQAHTVAMLT